MKARSGWSFTYIGIHPKTEVGVMVFTHGQEEATVELVSWPKTVVQLPPPILKKRAGATYHVQEGYSAPTVATATDLLALIRQGRCV